MKDYFRLLKFLKPHSGILGLAFICTVFSTIFDGITLSMIVPVTDKIMTKKSIIFAEKLPPFIQNLISYINSIQPDNFLRILVFLIPALFILKGFFNFFQDYFMSNIGQRVVKDIRNDIYFKLQDLSLEYYTSRRTGEIVSRITNDVMQVENAVSYGVKDLIYQICQIILFTFLIFFMYFKLAIFLIIMMGLMAWPMFKIGRLLKKVSRQLQEKMADINSLLFETVSGARIVKAFCMEKYEVAKFKTQNKEFYKIMMKLIKRTLALGPLTEIIGVFFAIIIFYFAGRDVIQDKLSFGVFAFFLTSVFQLIKPFRKLANVHSINQRAIAAGTRIFEVLEADVKIKDTGSAVNLPIPNNEIRFENVWFKYEDENILKEINFNIGVGKVLAIVGPSGAGKSTLVDLIPRFYDPYKGRIIIDNIDIKDVKIESLRRQIGIVTQETILFNDSVKGNISYGHPEIDEIKIIEAAKKANAYDFIQNLPQGLDTVIGDRGVKLSGGERQRIAIARAILKDPPILILDEATSQLDSESERLVQEALSILMKGRTVFVIAHRLSTVVSADQIIVLERGIIIERGNHQQLIQKQGLYSRLYEMQSL
ncbi:MAG: ABC transporter ATP-binding protein [Candidatus Omnitrophota bacterium]